MRSGRDRNANREMNCLCLRPENYEAPAVLTTDRQSCIDAAFPIDPRPERGLSGTFILLLDSTMHFLYSFVIGRHCLRGLVVGWRERKRDPGVLAFAFAALAFGLLTARTARFAEYFIPFAAATMALDARTVPRRGVVIAVVAILLLYAAKPISETVQGLRGRTERLPPKLASWLQQRIPRPGMAEVIRNRFGARFVISFLDERFSPFYFQLAAEPGVRPLLLSDEYWVVFDLGGPPP